MKKYLVDEDQLRDVFAAHWKTPADFEAALHACRAREIGEHYTHVCRIDLKLAGQAKFPFTAITRLSDIGRSGMRPEIWSCSNIPGICRLQSDQKTSNNQS